MKTSGLWTGAAAVAVSLIVACSSSSGGGGGGGIASCQGATASTGPGTPACNSCLQSSCSSQTSMVQSSCSAYVSCYAGCQCSDATCEVNCLSKVDSACMSPFQSLTACIASSCKSPCAPAVGASGDGGTD